MLPVFADPKTDVVFKRIFGSEARKPLLIALLNDLHTMLHTVAHYLEIVANGDVAKLSTPPGGCASRPSRPSPA